MRGRATAMTSDCCGEKVRERGKRGRRGPHHDAKLQGGSTTARKWRNGGFMAAPKLDGGRRFWRVGFCTRVEAAAVDGGRGEGSRRYLKGRLGASACGSRRGLGGAWPGRTRARVRLGREEGEGPDRWGPPTGGREGGRVGTGRDRGMGRLGWAM